MTPPLPGDESSHSTHSFVLRLWVEELGDGQSEWRGQVQQISSSEVRYFRDWQKLIEYLIEMLSDSNKGEHP